jgi:hypothetical protein
MKLIGEWSVQFSRQGPMFSRWRLLDLGFQAAITRIITYLPKQRRTGLFSATMTDADALSELVRVGLRNPARIVVKVQSKKVQSNSDRKVKEAFEERRTPAKSPSSSIKRQNIYSFFYSLQNHYIQCRPSEKLLQLVRIISHEVSQQQSSHFIIYFATCAGVDYFFKVGTIIFWRHEITNQCTAVTSVYRTLNNILFTTWQSYTFSEDKNADSLLLCDTNLFVTLCAACYRCRCSWFGPPKCRRCHSV